MMKTDNEYDTVTVHPFHVMPVFQSGEKKLYNFPSACCFGLLQNVNEQAQPIHPYVYVYTSLYILLSGINLVCLFSFLS